MPLLRRSRLAIRRHGAGGAFRHALRLARRRVVLEETHVWYALDLATDYPRARLSPSQSRRRGGPADAHLLAQLETVSPQEGVRRIEAGNHLNLVLEGERLVHCSFTFTSRLPAIAAAHEQLELPADTVCLEDGVTAPDIRGAGIAPENMTFVTDRLKDEGVRWVLVKVAVDNRSSRRMVEKGGFEEVALMHFKRRGMRARAWIEPLEDVPMHALTRPMAAGLRGAVSAPS